MNKDQCLTSLFCNCDDCELKQLVKQASLLGIYRTFLHSYLCQFQICLSFLCLLLTSLLVWQLMIVAYVIYEIKINQIRLAHNCQDMCEILIYTNTFPQVRKYFLYSIHIVQHHQVFFFLLLLSQQVFKMENLDFLLWQ